jgi:ankyrin repeat protein
MMTLEALTQTYPSLEKHTDMLKHAGFETDIDTFKVAAHLIKKGELDAIASMIEGGYDVNSAESGDFGSSLLHNAIRYDQMEIFNYLIDQGADIDFVDAVGWTPLMEAIIDSRPEFGKILVEKGCDQSIANKRGVNAKMLAMKFEKSDFLTFLD